MATFSQRKTGTTMTSWEYYVQDKEDWGRYKDTLKVEFTTKNLPILFKDTRGSSTIGSPLNNGTSLILLSNKSFIIEKKIHAHVQVGQNRGYLAISAIGKPARDTTRDENIALEQLDSAIKKRNMNGKGPGICIIVKGKGNQKQIFKNCIGAVTISGTPKADFAIINKDRKRICFISHKKEGGAKAYQQYVSVTGGKTDGINDHPTLKKYLKDVAARINTITEERVRYKRYIPFDQQGKILMLKSIYGPDYGKQFGVDHVNFIGQGTPSLKEADNIDRPKDCGTVFELTFSDDVSISGDLSHFQATGYKPIILARYTSERKFYVDGTMYTGARILIAPDALASGTVVELKS